MLKKYPAERYEKQTGRKPMIGKTFGESSNRNIEFFTKPCLRYDEKRQKVKIRDKTFYIAVYQFFKSYLRF